MSKIAEQKALEAYPMVNPPYSNSDEAKLNLENFYKRNGYIVGYDQDIQDFIEKACEWLLKNARNYYSAYATSDKLVEHFKKHMKNEN